MSTVFLKSTVRPWPSVSRPSSRICSSTLKTSGCAFSISSKSTTAVGPAAHRLGELPALVVADVARRRADEPGDGVLLHVLGHVDADHRVLVVEEELGQRLGRLGLPHAGGAEEDEGADGPVGILQAGAGAAHRVRTPPRSPVAGRSPACSSRSSMWTSFSTSPSISRETGMPVHLATTSAMSSASPPP